MRRVLYICDRCDLTTQPSQCDVITLSSSLFTEADELDQNLQATQTTKLIADPTETYDALRAIGRHIWSRRPLDDEVPTTIARCSHLPFPISFLLLLSQGADFIKSCRVFELPPARADMLGRDASEISAMWVRPLPSRMRVLISRKALADAPLASFEAQRLCALAKGSGLAIHALTRGALEFAVADPSRPQVQIYAHFPGTGTAHGIQCDDDLVSVDEFARMLAAGALEALDLVACKSSTVLSSCGSVPSLSVSPYTLSVPAFMWALRWFHTLLGSPEWSPYIQTFQAGWNAALLRLYAGHSGAAAP